MNRKLSFCVAILFLTVGASVLFSGCNTTKNLPDGKYLLVKNDVVLHTSREVKNRGEIKDNLIRLELQKPNSRIFLLNIPSKLNYYNFRYKKYHDKPDSLLPKHIERPVIFDTSLIGRTDQNMTNYLFNLGYYYTRIKDTFYVKRNKAYVTHHVYTGGSYKINNVNYNVPDTTIKNILELTRVNSNFKKGKDYSISLVDEERSRIVKEIRNNGYFHFNLENIVTFSLDTFDKSFFTTAVSPFEGAVNYLKNEAESPELKEDAEVIIRLGDDKSAFSRHTIGSVKIYPDFNSAADFTDTTLIVKSLNGDSFFYHKPYVNQGVLYNHIQITPGSYYSQDDHEKTFSQLNELGIFQYIKIIFTENPSRPFVLDCSILMSPIKKYDFLANSEVSSGTTYDLGLSGSLNVHNKNFLKGANLLTIGVNGGLEYSYNPNYGKDAFSHFQVLTQYVGLNASLDFPKFISPVGSNSFSGGNAPHTIISGGLNLIDRQDYFKMINTSFNYAYNWKKSGTITWSLSPVFFNIIRMPYETDSFTRHLQQFPFLEKSYKPNFIEGENISFTYNDIDKKKNRNYSYLRLAIEESGGLLSSLNQVGVALNNLYTINVAQYTKFDFDARHFFTFKTSSLAFRFSGGIGVPYDQSVTLPYIKQYFAGGPYSLRGWQVRTLGPGSYFDPANEGSTTIDLTADIKLEFTGEYRFLITPLFANALKLNGALFGDAGNIWLAHKDNSFPGGDFELNTLGQSVAADAGAGLRFDFATFLTVRFDVAMPIKKPYVGTNNGWVFNQIAFTDPTWRTNNIVLQFAIGYPF